MSIINIDTNVVARVLLNDPSAFADALGRTRTGTLRVEVLTELVHIMLPYYTDVYASQGYSSLEARDASRRDLDRDIRTLCQGGMICEGTGVFVCAMQVFQYRRLDWVDSYLIARKMVLGEDYSSFDKKAMHDMDVILESGNRIPVISSYTQSLDDLPPRVFIQEKDVKHFIEAGLLHIQPPREEDRAKHMPASKGMKPMDLFSKR